jgi:anti-sigma factor RsiW
MNCEQARASIQPYVDNELCAVEQFALEAHFLECESCRAEYESMRQVVDTVRGSSPLYPCDPSLSTKIQQILEDDRSKLRDRRRLRVAAMAAAFAATVVVAALIPSFRTQRFTSFAADTHLRYARGSFPLEVASDQPQVVSAWMQSNLPFHLGLPNYPALPGEAKGYALVGARRMQFEGHDIAYLAYTMGTHPISLLVASSAKAIPSGSQAYTSGKLVFHFSSEKGLKLITWEDRGLTYALVSDVQVEGAQSCIVCHGSQSERKRFENLLRLE